MGKTEQPLPYDADVERAVVGAVLLASVMNRPESIELALTILTPSDFYVQAWATCFDAIGRCWRSGVPLEVLAVGVEVERLGFPQCKTDLADALASAPMSYSMEHYCRLVIDSGSRRRLVEAGLTIMEAARSGMSPAEELIIQARELIELVDVGTTMFLPDGLSTLDEFFERPEEDWAPWVIPGMMRRDWRVEIVAGEGSGKSTLLRQIAISAAAGLHPFTHRPCEPVRSLSVDLENPAQSVEEMCAPMKAEAEGRVTWDPDRCWLWRQPGGVDLRSRAGRVAFEGVLRASRPDLVCFGPIYKSFTARKDEEESAVAEVQHVLDDLRTRYDFALLFEHHAPHGESGRRREMRPHGSVRWQRWPELGISLLPVKDRPGSLKLGRFRGDRLAAQWPERLDRSGNAWPWDALYPAGTFDPARPEELAPEF